MCVAAGDQSGVVGTPDGAGGAFIAWLDGRIPGTQGVYAVAIDPDGGLRPGWAANGSPIRVGSGYCSALATASDGSGGAFLAWLDTRDGGSGIYLQRVLGSGAIATGWPGNGQRVSTSTSLKTLSMDGDGSGGVLLAARDDANPAMPSIYAFRVMGSGAYPSGWGASGRLLRTFSSALSQTIIRDVQIIDDGTGGGFTTLGSIGVDHGQKYVATEMMHFTDAGKTISEFYGAPPSTGTPCASDGAGGIVLGYNGCTRIAHSDAVAWESSMGVGTLKVVTDAAGGALIGWESGSGLTEYMLRLDSRGVVAAGWPDTGAEIAKPGVSDAIEDMAPDGAGGAYMCWNNAPLIGTGQLYASCRDSGGQLPPGWFPHGNPVCTLTATRTRARAIPDGRGGAFLLWADTRNGNYDVFAQRLGPAVVPAAAASLIEQVVQSNHVGLAWLAPGAAGRAFTVLRSWGFSWDVAALVGADDQGRVAFDDREVQPGARYGYRIQMNGSATPNGETWVVVPRPGTLALRIEGPNPLLGDLRATITLPDDAPATLEAIDVTGRVLAYRDVGALGPGVHTVLLSTHEELRPGVVFVRLARGADTRTVKVAAIR